MQYTCSSLQQTQLAGLHWVSIFQALEAQSASSSSSCSAVAGTCRRSRTCASPSACNGRTI
eukprot:767058-Hanusia_phi.AAC.1